MDIITAAIIKISLWLLPHLNIICIAQLSTLLVIYGDSFHKYIKTNIRSMNFFFRIVVFVMICTFAYGGLLAFVAPLLAQYMAKIPSLYLAPSILLSFIIIGVLAEHRKYI